MSDGGTEPIHEVVLVTEHQEDVLLYPADMCVYVTQHKQHMPTPPRAPRRPAVC